MSLVKTRRSSLILICLAAIYLPLASQADASNWRASSQTCVRNVTIQLATWPDPTVRVINPYPGSYTDYYTISYQPGPCAEGGADLDSVSTTAGAPTRGAATEHYDGGGSCDNANLQGWDTQHRYVSGFYYDPVTAMGGGTWVISHGADAVETIKLDATETCVDKTQTGVSTIETVKALN